MSRYVIVTGASRGIGLAVAQRLIRDGFLILNLDRQAPTDSLLNAHYIPIDLEDTNELLHCLNELTSQYQILHIVNNAAIVRPELILDTSIDSMRQVAKVNIEAPLMITQAVLPAMRQCGFGRIVNISSRAALGKQNRTAYSAAKAGLLGMTRTWALEMASQGITVNAIGPGPIATELFCSANPPEATQTQKILESIPMQRVGKPDEIAHAVSFFMDDLASFTTGQILYVCGGMTVGLANV